MPDTGKPLNHSPDYRLFFDNAPLGYAYHKIVKDKKGKAIDYIFLSINSSFEKLTGLRGDLILGVRATKAIPGLEKDPARLIERYGEVAIKGLSTQFETYATPLNRWYHVVAYSPVKDHFVSIFNDITDRKTTEENQKRSEALLRAIAENLPNACISIIEKDMTTSFSTDAELKQRGHESANLVGASLENTFGEHSVLVRTYYEKTFKGERCNFELLINNQHQNYSTVPLFNDDGSVSRILVSVENISDRKINELKLKEHQELLEQMVKERTKELEQKNKELDRALKAFVGREMLIKDLQKKLKDY